MAPAHRCGSARPTSCKSRCVVTYFISPPTIFLLSTQRTFLAERVLDVGATLNDWEGHLDVMHCFFFVSQLKHVLFWDYESSRPFFFGASFPVVVLATL